MSLQSFPSNTSNNEMMRAIAFGSEIGKYKEVMRNIPKPSNRDKLLVQVRAVGLNPVDAKVVVGDKLPHSWKSLRKFVHSRLVRDTVVGFDFAGVVKHVPDNANNRFRVGDAVFGTMPPLQGSLAEYVSVPMHQVCRMPTYPDSLPRQQQFQRASSLPLVGLTALQCLGPHLTDTGSLRRRSVLILGASGGTGHVALQVARNLLTDENSSSSTTATTMHITAVCSSRNTDFVRNCGATHVVDYAQPQEDLIRDLKNSPGCPFDVIMDCVTSDDPRDTETINYPLLLQNPQHGLVSASGDYVYRRLGGPTVDWIRASLDRTLFSSSCWWYPNPAERLFWIKFPHSEDGLEQLKLWVDEERLHVAIETVAEFTVLGIENAMDALLSRRVRGKVVVNVYEE